MVVEQAEGVGVAGAGQLDERDQPLTVGRVVLRRRGEVGVAVPAAVGADAGARVVVGHGLGEQAEEPACGGVVGQGRTAGQRRRGTRRARERVGEGVGDQGAQGVEPAHDLLGVQRHW